MIFFKGTDITLPFNYSFGISLAWGNYDFSIKR